MRVAFTALAASVLLGGCASKNRVSRVTVPSTSMQPVMQRQVLNAVDAGEGNPRVKSLRERLEAEPQNVKVRLELAEEYGKSGHGDLELDHLRLAVERFPDSEAALASLSRALVRIGQPLEAWRRLQEYITAHEKASATIYSWAGIAADGMENWKEGETWHRRAVERSPGRDQLHNNLGYNLLQQGRKSEAAEAFRRALELNPASETARNNLGVALGDQPAAAITQFRQTSDLAVAHNNLAAYLYEKGDVAGARKELETALEYRKNEPRILENLRKLSAADGKPVLLNSRPHHSFWKTFARGLKQTFVASEEKRTAGAADAGR